MRAAKGKVNELATGDLRRPYVVAALLCERAISDSDDGVISIIRIVDRFYLDGNIYIDNPALTDLNDEFLPAQIGFTFIFIVMEMPKEGVEKITVQPFGPDGRALGDLTEVLIGVGGAATGSTLRMPITLQVGHSGSHYLSVRYRGRELARSPFIVEDRRERFRFSPSEPLASGSILYRAQEQMS